MERTAGGWLMSERGKRDPEIKRRFQNSDSYLEDPGPVPVLKRLLRLTQERSQRRVELGISRHLSMSLCAFYYFFAPAASSLRITPWLSSLCIPNDFARERAVKPSGVLTSMSAPLSRKS